MTDEVLGDHKQGIRIKLEWVPGKKKNVVITYHNKIKQEFLGKKGYEITNTLNRT